MSKQGLFITFEGTDGVGKSTQLQLTRAWLQKLGFDVLLTREPGGGPVAEKIRSILLDPKHEIENLTELFLYQAARIEHVEKIVKPALKKGKLVLCDRFTDSTLAYQGAGRRLMKPALLLNKISTGGLKPNLTILLTLSPKIGLKKALRRDSSCGGDRLENEGLAFQKIVHQAFLGIARHEPSRVKMVPVQKEIEATQKIIQTFIKRKIHGNSRTN